MNVHWWWHPGYGGGSAQYRSAPRWPAAVPALSLLDRPSPLRQSAAPPMSPPTCVWLHVTVGIASELVGLYDKCSVSLIGLSRVIACDSKYSELVGLYDNVLCPWLDMWVGLLKVSACGLLLATLYMQTADWLDPLMCDVFIIALQGWVSWMALVTWKKKRKKKGATCLRDDQVLIRRYPHHNALLICNSSMSTHVGTCCWQSGVRCCRTYN